MCTRMLWLGWTVEDRNLQCVGVAFLVFILIWQTRELTFYLNVDSKALIALETSWESK